MKFPILLSFFLSISFVLSAQNINFALADPSPEIQGGLMGDIEMADIDNDGDIDMFICGRIDGWSSSDASRIYLNDGNGNLEIVTDTPFEDMQFADAEFNDIDGDGDLDLFLVGRGDASVPKSELYINDGTGSFELLNGTPFIGVENAAVDFGDVDGDGDDDVFICGNQMDDSFSKLYLNQGAAEFLEAAATNFLPVTAAAAKFIDVDGDDDLDLITIGTGTDDNQLTALYINDGNAGFQMTQTIIEPRSSVAFATGDLDQDGDLDILVSGNNSESSAISELYLNDGSGTFSPFSGNDIFPNVAIGNTIFHDLDQDTDLDIVISGSSDGGLNGDLGIITQVYENLGNNNYILTDSLPGSYFSNNGVGDLNGDGLADLVLSGTTIGIPTFKTWVYFNSTDLTTGLEQLSEAQFEIFPNPSNGLINIQMKDAKEASIQIFNMAGKLVFHQETIATEAVNFELDLPSGLYNLVLKNSDQFESQKIIIVD